MTLSPARVPEIGVRRLTATLYGYSFLDDFVLLYPVYALLFAETGMSLWQISSLFALWSITGVVLEVPSGAWADAVSRRRLLWIGPLLTAVGFGLWVAVPSYWAFAAGFVLWGAGGALGSGALEALVYDELDRLGAADRYARVMGRSRAARLVGTVASIGLAGPVFARGGYAAVGAASFLACVLTALTATRFPEHRVRPGTGGDSWATTLRTGLAEVRRDRAVRGALLLMPAVAAVWGALDEYTPLLVREIGFAEATVPYLIMLIWAGVTAAASSPDRPNASARGARGAARGCGARPRRRRRGPLIGRYRPAEPRLRRVPAGGGARRRPPAAPDRRVPPGHAHLRGEPRHRAGHGRHLRRVRAARHGRRAQHRLRGARGSLPGDGAGAG